MLQLNPDRLGSVQLRPYPLGNAGQKLLKEHEMPTTDEKLHMLLRAITHLTKSRI